MISELVTIYSTPDFWYFNKHSLALALVVAASSGLVFGLFHELGKTLWFFIKRLFHK